MAQTCSDVADRLEQDGISVTLADARFAKPFDADLVRDLATTHDAFMIVEESSPGGFSAHLLQFMAAEGLLDTGLKMRVASLPDEYIDHADRGRQLAGPGLMQTACMALAGQIVTTRPGRANKTTANPDMRKRVDLVLVDRGLVPSREKARALIQAGAVRCNNQPVTKPGQLVLP